MDVYQNPTTRFEWLVLDKDDDDKLIKICMIGYENNSTMWKKNTDRVFGFPCVQEGY